MPRLLQLVLVLVLVLVLQVKAQSGPSQLTEGARKGNPYTEQPTTCARPRERIVCPMRRLGVSSGRQVTDGGGRRRRRCVGDEEDSTSSMSPLGLKEGGRDDSRSGDVDGW
ncbi:hypothetical protein LX36DRAFT_671503 [Colletotrichum falcatum]|nr:hypothetical protein LX36DRAFT_671503 [Colletotrichum falcatum]